MQQLWRGRSSCPGIQFHHEGDKEAEVSPLMGRGAFLDALKAEIAKCIVLCASCRRTLTSDERGCYKEGKRRANERPRCGSNAQPTD